MSQIVPRSPIGQRLGAATAAAVVVASAASAYTGSAAAQADESFVRGVGIAAIRPASASSIHVLGLVCGPAGTAGMGAARLGRRPP